MNTPPFIPEFSQYKERNKWIFENATYFTVIRRKHRAYLREEQPSYDDAVKYAKKQLEREPDSRFLIYAITGWHDALVATVSKDSVVRHE